MLAMSVLREFLSSAANSIKSVPCPLRVVMGNEACDLDSTVSALVFAFYLNIASKTKDEKPVIPVLNINKEDYKLRVEIDQWLSRHGIAQQDILFRDDLDLHSLFKSNCLDLVLVDHNKLSPADSSLDPAVSLICDHHKQERSPLPDGSVLATVASCSTLVAEEIFNNAPDIMKYPVPELLYGAILFDSFNFSESANNTSARDIAVFEKLGKVLSTPLNKDEEYDAILKTRTNISVLTTDECLRKDVKTIGFGEKKIAIASIPTLIQNFFKRSDIEECLPQFVSKYKLHFLIIMGMCVEGDSLKRELVVYSPDIELRNKVANYLKEADNSKLSLELIPSTIPNCTLLKQNNVSASRKAVLPMMERWYSQTC